ncbi:hypothetical protein BC827DRAFT_1387397 [Russula dissimulans]|nr:hypothetical protein BC827DRAFT_1387397 [Russula dissimulans]
MWDRQCVSDWLEGNDYTVQFEDNPTACELKLTRPNQAAPDDQIVLQVMAVDEYTLIDDGSSDFDPQGSYPCGQDYTVKLVCEVMSGDSQTLRDVIVAKSDQFEICGSGTTNVKDCGEWREDDDLVPLFEEDVEELLGDNTCPLDSESTSFEIMVPVPLTI